MSQVNVIPLEPAGAPHASFLPPRPDESNSGDCSNESQGPQAIEPERVLCRVCEAILGPTLNSLQATERRREQPDLYWTAPTRGVRSAIQRLQ